MMPAKQMLRASIGTSRIEQRSIVGRRVGRSNSGSDNRRFSSGTALAAVRT